MIVVLLLGQEKQGSYGSFLLTLKQGSVGFAGKDAGVPGVAEQPEG